jgi:tetrahydromethanopterin S-methyltransferase subunit G
MQVPNESKEAAQDRLDNETKKVGYVRGELYQLPDGSWGIHWGGKYRL